MSHLERRELIDTPAHDHHGSHTKLIDHIAAETAACADIGAVIVPAARHTESLRTAIGLVGELEAVCLALCSKDADPSEAVRIGTEVGATVVAVQISADIAAVLPVFETTKMLDDAKLGKNNDIALKRNLGLLLARLSSWGRILFLDDDVAHVNADDVAAAAGLLHDYDAVGLWNSGFRDNSVVCHANREAFPGSQDQFISTMALALTIGTGSFFPNIYNEDWFFFLGELPAGRRRPRLAATGKVWQAAYDPFADSGRARREEFGDTIAEGLFWLLDEKQPLENADINHWRSYLQVRRDFIEHILKQLHDAWRGDPVSLESRVAALEAAQEQNQAITPQFCVDYVEAWRADLGTWRDFIAGQRMPESPDIAGALDQLGLTPHTHTS